MLAKSHPFVFMLSDIDEADRDLVSDEGTLLARMRKLQLPVADSCFIASTAFKQFVGQIPYIAEFYEILNGIAWGDTNEIRATSAKLRQLLEQMPIPQSVEEGLAMWTRHKDPEDCYWVRPITFAPFDQTNAPCAPDQMHGMRVRAQEVQAAIKACWIEHFSSKSIAFRKAVGMRHDAVLMAVLIQKVEREGVGGSLYSMDVLHWDYTSLLIEYQDPFALCLLDRGKLKQRPLVGSVGTEVASPNLLQWLVEISMIIEQHLNGPHQLLWHQAAGKITILGVRNERVFKPFWDLVDRNTAERFFMTFRPPESRKQALTPLSSSIVGAINRNFPMRVGFVLVHNGRISLDIKCISASVPQMFLKMWLAWDFSLPSILRPRNRGARFQKSYPGSRFFDELIILLWLIFHTLIFPPRRILRKLELFVTERPRQLLAVLDNKHLSWQDRIARLRTALSECLGDLLVVDVGLRGVHALTAPEAIADGSVQLEWFVELLARLELADFATSSDNADESLPQLYCKMNPRLRGLARFTPHREYLQNVAQQTEREWTSIWAALRALLDDVASDLVERSFLDHHQDLYFLTWEELLSIATQPEAVAKMRGKIENRKKQWHLSAACRWPALWTSWGRSVFNASMPQQSKHVIQGIGLSPGCRQGYLQKVSEWQRHDRRHLDADGSDGILIMDASEVPCDLLFFSSALVLTNLENSARRILPLFWRLRTPIVLLEGSALDGLTSGSFVIIDGVRGTLTIEQEGTCDHAREMNEA